MHSAIADRNVHTPPPISQFAALKASDVAGSLYLVFACGLTGLSLYLSSFSETSIWLIGQLLFAMVFVQWFAILHEAGHKLLFRTPILNIAAGHLAGFLAGFPFDCWKLIHGLHHHWTGWQDLDATTAGLTPRERSKWILLAVRICWACWIPIFSVIYRLDNYWNVPRLQKLFARKRTLLQFAISIGGQFLLYGLVVYLVGPWQLLKLIGLGVLLGLMIEDLLILSQHTHVPMQVSHGEPVAPIPPLQQEVFTRSLRFPTWFSRLILLNLDAHELHHMYVQVPGYLLHRIEYVPHNEISWRQWMVKSKQVRGDVLLFQNRNQTGLEF
jgi:omega-6 fatty acid desaturase (delta-12 desaturase)